MSPLSSTAYETPDTTAYKTPEWAAAAVAEGKDPADVGRARVWLNSIVSTVGLTVGLALSSWANTAQAQNVAIACDPSIATKAMERHQLRIKLAKEAWDNIDEKSLEINMKSRVANLCALDIQTQADKQMAAEYMQAAAVDKQAAAVDKQAAAVDKQAAATIMVSAQLKEERAAADKQAAAKYREMSEIMNRIEKWVRQPTDLARLSELYQSIVRTATINEKERDLPIIASALRKLGIAV